jgi:hypothetical protein
MTRSLKIANKFGRKLGALFEKFDSRTDELQANLDSLIQGFLDGAINTAHENHPTDGTCYLPLIEGHVVVFLPSESTFHHRDNALKENVMDFSHATDIDILTIEDDE